jgi:hypothetical protein
MMEKMSRQNFSCEISFSIAFDMRLLSLLHVRKYFPFKAQDE